jgi:DNA polymerase III epsilon subunit family exonuclease
VTFVTGDRPGFAVVDVETTGFAPQQERIVELAVVVLTPAGEEEEAWCTLVDPGCDPGPTHVHGITADMLRGAPTFAEIHGRVADRLSGRVVVGHNVDGFDLPFLRAEFRRVTGTEVAPDGLATLDTLRLAQSLLGLRGRARLVDCCDHFGLTWEDHHNALGDARVTAALLGAVRAKLGDEALQIDRLLEAARGSRWPGAGADPASGHDPVPVRGRTGSLAT